MIAIVVTTKNRGVFFGLCEDPINNPRDLHQARMCLYWSCDVSGFTGLAEKGPTKDCRISAPTPRLLLRGGEDTITSVQICSDEAKEAWIGAPCVGR